MRIAALVPLRGGSKSIPRKNIKPIAGRPLAHWVLESAFQSEVFDTIAVSTEDVEIAAICSRAFPRLRIIERPLELATDEAGTEAVMLHAAGLMDFDAICLIQATSPMTTPDDFSAASRLFIEGGYDSMLTAVRWKRFLWTPEGKPLNYDPASRPRRQDFGGSLLENGAFYLTRKETLLATGSRLGGRIGIYEMAPDTSAEIDEPDDWEHIERLLKRKLSTLRESMRKVRLMLFDVDGTLTDGAMYYGADGEALKRFSTRDGMGMGRLKDSGLEVGIITSEDSVIVKARAQKLGIERVHTGIKDKLAFVRDIAEREGLCMGEIGFMGDDVNDRGVMEACGFSACPSDAVKEIREVSMYICGSRGGEGAARELCEALMEARRN